MDAIGQSHITRPFETRNQKTRTDKKDKKPLRSAFFLLVGMKEKKVVSQTLLFLLFERRSPTQNKTFFFFFLRRIFLFSSHLQPFSTKEKKQKVERKGLRPKIAHCCKWTG